MRTRARGSFFISKPWFRRERQASHLLWLPGAPQQRVGDCDLPRPAHVSLSNCSLSSLFLRASFPQGSGCTVASGSDGSRLGELWEMLQKCGSCVALVGTLVLPWEEHWAGAELWLSQTDLSSTDQPWHELAGGSDT